MAQLQPTCQDMRPLRRRQTKILATLGPASATQERIGALFKAGADAFRINFSHGTVEDHAARVRCIRALEKDLDRPICILADLQGPKLRVGTFAGGAIDLAAGQKFRLDLEAAPGTKDRVQLPHPEIFKALIPGQELLLDDGRVRLGVERCGPDFAETTVISGTRLSDRKGVNVPGVILPLSPLTEKDRRDLASALEMGVDWVALSFVQRPEDLDEARRLMGSRPVALMSKLEKPAAILALDAIVEKSDGVMIARGDLGVEMPPEDVPSIQKRILSLARRMGKPVVVATQMLESMISAPAPTRAEASDVATAVYDGTDAIMLSAETASGQYPVEAVAMMDRIAHRVESDSYYRTLMQTQHPELQHTTADAISAAARQVAATIEATAIVTYTTSGSTTIRASRERPIVPILGLTSSEQTARRLSLCYGVHAVRTSDIANFGEMVEKACATALKDHLARKGDKLVITAGVPFGTPGNTNILRIAVVA